MAGKYLFRPANVLYRCAQYLLLPLVARCLETIDVCIWHMFLFNDCCGDCVWVCRNVCCVAIFVEDIGV